MTYALLIGNRNAGNYRKLPLRPRGTQKEITRPPLSEIAPPHRPRFIGPQSLRPPPVTTTFCEC